MTITEYLFLPLKAWWQLFKWLRFLLGLIPPTGALCYGAAVLLATLYAFPIIFVCKLVRANRGMESKEWASNAYRKSVMATFSFTESGLDIFTFAVLLAGTLAALGYAFSIISGANFSLNVFAINELVGNLIVWIAWGIVTVCRYRILIARYGVLPIRFTFIWSKDKVDTSFT